MFVCVHMMFSVYVFDVLQKKKEISVVDREKEVKRDKSDGG